MDNYRISTTGCFIYDHTDQMLEEYLSNMIDLVSSKQHLLIQFLYNTSSLSLTSDVFKEVVFETIRYKQYLFGIQVVLDTPYKVSIFNEIISSQYSGLYLHNIGTSYIVGISQKSYKDVALNFLQNNYPEHCSDMPISTC